MQTFGDKYVAMLKIDIEGFEIEVIPELVRFWQTSLPRAQWPRLLAFDMDSIRKGHPRRNEPAARRCMKLLTDAGYQQFSWTGGADIVYLLRPSSS